jgi:glycosyltransferase involved in cell wall biosynthesis
MGAAARLPMPAAGATAASAAGASAVVPPGPGVGGHGSSPARSLLARPVPEAVPLLAVPPLEPTVFLGSLARGGAERLVVSWLEQLGRLEQPDGLDPGRTAGPGPSGGPRPRVRVVVLRRAAAEYPVPGHVRVDRVVGPDRLARLAGVAAGLAGGPPVLCHLLDDGELATLWAQGVATIPVIHNDRPGWRSTPARFPPARVPLVIAVSDAVAAALRAGGWRGPLTVVRAPVAAPPGSADARIRAAMRGRLGIPEGELLVVMVGGVKPQKAYPRAVRALAAIRAARLARLAIVGGPVGRDGATAWAAAVAQAGRLHLTDAVLLPGFVAEVGPWLAAADVFLNTSLFEGLSVATQEALAAGLPAVATDVGGQREIESARLRLVPPDATPEAIAAAVLAAPPRRLAAGEDVGASSGARTAATRVSAGEDAGPASGARDAATRLWTGFAAWPARLALRREVLLVTANLNAGGAQRSLVTVAAARAARLPLAVAAVDGTTQPHFAAVLRANGVPLFRPAPSRDPFAVAEVLAARGVPAVVCFWNADPRLKLLLVKLWEALGVRFVDVSPGPHAWRELAATGDFQRAIALDAPGYYRRLDRLVLKYRAPRAERPVEPLGRRARVIPNGIAADRPVKADYRLGTPPRIVVAGRIAPMKRLDLALEAMPGVWREFPDAELHVFGAAEVRDAGYVDRLLAALGDPLPARIVWHGACPELAARLPGFDAALVLGEHQGCPNWGLEALAAGLPTVANASGGTGEQVIDGRTGLLLPADPEAGEVAAAVIRLLADRRLARRLGRRAARHVRRRFTLTATVARYERLLGRLLGAARAVKAGRATQGGPAVEAGPAAQDGPAAQAARA